MGILASAKIRAIRGQFVDFLKGIEAANRICETIEFN
jgi:hypothetical protein